MSVRSKRVLAVPFLDFSTAHRSLRSRLLEDIGHLIDTGAFSNGPSVAEFEQAFAQYCGRAECVGVASGLDALRLALLTRDIGPGDEVIVPAATFVATFEAVSQVGARPVPADVSEIDYTLDPLLVEAAITDLTRALLPVHLYGQLADMRSLGELARARSLDIVEDACQAHGASRDGLQAGGTGVVAAFSFYPAKNLGAFGDAGALVCDDAHLADRVRALKEHGQLAKYQHKEIGYTARLDTIQALILLRKLPLLDGWNEQRRAAAHLYSEMLDGLGDLRVPRIPDGSAPAWHLYVVRTARPDLMAGFLHERGIETGRHYPEPVHLTESYAHLGLEAGMFPVAERLSEEALSLPIFPGITEEQQARVVEAIHDYFANG